MNAADEGTPSLLRRMLRPPVRVLGGALAIILLTDLGIMVSTGSSWRETPGATLAELVSGAVEPTPEARREHDDTSRSGLTAAEADPGDVTTLLPPVPQSPAPAPPPAIVGEPRIRLVRVDQRLAAFAGLSTWVDLWDTGLSPERQVDIAAASGVQTIFVQSARFNSPRDIHDPLRLSVLIDRARDRRLKVMVWYIPDFLDEAKDLRRSLAAINFVSQHGNRADAFGLDIETEHQRNVAERSARLVRLSQRIRDAVGPSYPMSAIVLPPLQLDMRPNWWPGFPWKEIAPYYDVWIPMSYSSFRGQDPETTYRWNFLNIVEMRNRVGNPNLNVHMAGGIADRLPHVDAFVAAVRDGLCLGGGLYDLHTTRPEAWATLRQMRAEPL